MLRVDIVAERFDVVIFGLLATPTGAAFLIRETGSPISPAFYVVLSAVICAASFLLIKDSTHAPLG